MLGLKMSTLSNHMRSNKHVSSKTKMAAKEARERDIASALRKHNEETHMRGETFPEQQQVYFVRVVSSFLCAGVPIAKLTYFRDILEENAFRLADRRNMSDYISFIHKEEEAHICITYF